MENTEQKIPPKDKWKDLTLYELYNVKSELQNLYHNLKKINPNIANEYNRFILSIDALISLRAEQDAQEKDQD